MRLRAAEPLLSCLHAGLQWARLCAALHPIRLTRDALEQCFILALLHAIDINAAIEFARRLATGNGIDQSGLA